MGIYNETLDSLIEKVARMVLHDWHGGTATGGTTATLVDAVNRTESDDYFNSLPYAELYIRTTTDGLAPQGETRRITDFANSSGTITVSPSFSAAVGAGDTYSIHTEFKREEIKHAINMAILTVAKEALTWAVDDTSITLTAGVYEYELPLNFAYIHRIIMADSNGNFDGQPEIPSSHWTIVHDATPYLRFEKFPPDGISEKLLVGGLWAENELVDGRAIRLEGLVYPTTLSADTDVCSLPTPYVVYQAGAILLASRVKRSDVEPDNYSAQAALWQQRADLERGRLALVQLPPGAKRVWE